MSMKAADQQAFPRTLRVRIKDRHAGKLRAMAADVNLVWNYCNDLSSRIVEREQRFPSAFELQSYLAGASKHGLRVGSRVFQEVAKVYAQQRKAARLKRLGWRGSQPGRPGFRPGWIPFKAGELRHDGQSLLFGGHRFQVWDSYGFAQFGLRGGSITEDHRGHWYLCVTVRNATRAAPARPDATIYIDASDPKQLILSDGRFFDAAAFMAGLERTRPQPRETGKSEQRWKYRQKVAARRRDFVQKLSTELGKRAAIPS